MIGRILVAAVVAVLLLGPSRSAQAQATSGADEFALKAAFLYNFTRFVEWPEASFEGPDSPFRICVLGSDPFGPRLDALASRRVGSRPIAVERLRSADGMSRCQIAYLASDSSAATKAAALSAVQTLTVASESRFARDGGMVALVTGGSRVHLHVNLATIQQSPLKFSAKLLEVAEVRHQRTGARE